MTSVYRYCPKCQKTHAFSREQATPIEDGSWTQSLVPLLVDLGLFVVAFLLVLLWAFA